MQVDLVEYAQPIKWQWGRENLNLIEWSSLLWQERLGLAQAPFEIQYIGENQHTLRVLGVTGFIKVGDLSLDIRPKFLDTAPAEKWRKSLWKILVAVEKNPLAMSLADADITLTDSFADLLGWVFVDSLQRASQEGMPRGYTETEELLPVLRGRLDSSRLIDTINHPGRIPCVFDIYSEDIPANRLFRWGANVLKHSVRSLRLSRLLSDISDSFSYISLQTPGLLEVEHLTLPFQFSHLDPALNVCRLLYRQQSLYHSSGEITVPGFLWHSSDVFEKFARYLLQQVCLLHEGWTVEKTTQVLGLIQTPIPSINRTIQVIPDFILKEFGNPLITLDAKYKIWSAQPKASDFYQVLAAARISDSSKAALIYPSDTNELRAPITWKIVAACNPLQVSALFLNLTTMGDADGEQRLVSALDKDLDSLL